MEALYHNKTLPAHTKGAKKPDFSTTQGRWRPDKTEHEPLSFELSLNATETWNVNNA